MTKVNHKTKIYKESSWEPVNYSQRVPSIYVVGHDNIMKENNGVTWEEALLLITNKQEWRSWIAQCARHGMDKPTR